MIQKAKKEVFGHFLEFGVMDRLDILDIVLELNVLQLQAILPGHEGSFKNHKNAFFNDRKGQKRGFQAFS